MQVLQLIFFIPFVLGLASLFMPKKVSLYGGIFALFSSASVLGGGISALPFFRFSFPGAGVLLQGGILSLVLVIITGVFGILVSLYSMGHLDEAKGFFWTLFCWLIPSSAGVFLAENLSVLLVFWGITGMILALMIWQTGNEEIGKKTFIIVGGSDALMMLGLVGLGFVSQTVSLSEMTVRPGDYIGWVIFISLVIASLTKAGAMPFHTWVPDTAKNASVPVTAILPASIDKLLGIFLLKRIVMDWFIVTKGTNFILLAVGAVTIIAAVFMALIQHNLKKLLGYHAVSQVGYMVMGLGTGNPIGIAGGLLHMVNNSIYKQSMFLGAGVLEKRVGSADLEDMGGLFKGFPVTFIGFLICAMAISGIPPLNGFVSKWLVYQGVVEMGKSGGSLWVIWLVTAVFGSALTLASFVKIIHSGFLGQPSEKSSSLKEKLTWQIPALIILPLSCIVIGIFPSKTVYPILRDIVGPLALPGLWQPELGAGLLLFGIGVAVMFYLLFKVNGFRVSETYIGGEKLEPGMRVSGVDFYNTIENLYPINKIYSWARKGYFDIYNLFKGFSFYWIRLLRWLHSGVLSVYVLWAVLGGVIVLAAVFK